MKLKLSGLIFLSLLGFANAQGGMGPGPGTVHSAGSSYTGPGDIVSGAHLWFSCARGYNAADTANACNVCLPSDTVCADLTLSNGFAVVPGSLSTCNITTVICTVKTMYDKTGNGRDATTATESQRPTFRPAMASNGCPTTTLPCLLFTPGNSNRLVTAALTLSQPITASMVFYNVATNGDMWSSGDNQIAMVRFGSNNVAAFSPTFGSRLDISVSDAANHAAQVVFNGASSAAYVDGSTTSGPNPGSSGFSSTVLTISPAAHTTRWSGYLSEYGLWGSAFNGTQAGDMNTNQHSAAYGYNF